VEIVVPRVVDYSVVLQTLRSQGMRCHYYNSGAFGFVDSSNMKAVAWVGPEDPTIRENARPLVRQIAPPYPATLAKMASAMWRDRLGGGTAWIMPMSHWAFELDHGHKQWMPGALESIGIDPKPLETMATAAAIAFEPSEAAAFESFLEQLLSQLKASDFAIAFPGKSVLCTVHHHQQLWWMTTDAAVIEAAEELARVHY
jgi:hypothetical protein